MAKKQTSEKPSRPTIRRRSEPRKDEQKGRQAAGNLLEPQLRELDRLATIGTAASRFAHEFNNVTTVVRNKAKLALADEDKEQMRDALELTLEQTALLSRMLDQVLGLAGRDKDYFEQVNIHDCTARAVELIRPESSRGRIKVKTEVDPKLTAWTDAGRLQQVLFNMLINALRAIGSKKGRITITGRREGRNVHLAISDNGCGIPPEQLENIFKPYFTTKNEQDEDVRLSSGLGLAICKEFIENQGGHLGVESRPGEGTTFHITLPAEGGPKNKTEAGKPKAKGQNE